MSEHDAPADISVHDTVIDRVADLGQVDEPIDLDASQVHADATDDLESDAADDDETDDETDARLEGLDDGSAAVGASTRPAAEALPFTMSAREHFAAVVALDDTGDARVDAATARLAEVPDLPTSDHVEVYEDVHRRLQEALAEAEVR